jgi:hypothetical protein
MPCRVNLILTFTLLGVLAACSNKQLYTAVQQNRQQECATLPQQQYEDCMRHYQQSYEAFDRERRALLEGQPPGEVAP